MKGITCQGYSGSVAFFSIDFSWSAIFLVNFLKSQAIFGKENSVLKMIHILFFFLMYKLLVNSDGSSG